MNRTLLFSALVLALGLFAAPANAQVVSGQTMPINVSSATTTLLITGVPSRPTQVTAFNVIVAAADNVTFESGYGPTCGSGTFLLTGAYPLAANGGIAQGTGLGAVMLVPPGQNLCIVTTAATQASGLVSFAQ